MPAACKHRSSLECYAGLTPYPYNENRMLGPGNNQDLALNVFPVSTPQRSGLSKRRLYVIYHIEGGVNRDIQVANSRRSRINSRTVWMRKYVREQYDVKRLNSIIGKWNSWPFRTTRRARDLRTISRCPRLS